MEQIQHGAEGINQTQDGGVFFIIICLFCFFLLFGDLPPSSQINTQRLILSYECLALGCLISTQLFLSYLVYLSLVDVYPYSIYISLHLTPQLTA